VVLKTASGLFLSWQHFVIERQSASKAPRASFVIAARCPLFAARRIAGETAWRTAAAAAFSRRVLDGDFCTYFQRQFPHLAGTAASIFISSLYISILFGI
jgi:hypothetical protein